MDAQTLTYIFVFLTFGLYIGIAIWGKSQLNQRVLCRRRRSASDRQRHGHRSRLDERGFFHFHGRYYFVHGLRRDHLPAGVDRRLCHFSSFTRTVFTQIRRVYGAPISSVPAIIRAPRELLPLLLLLQFLSPTLLDKCEALASFFPNFLTYPSLGVLWSAWLLCSCTLSWVA